MVNKRNAYIGIDPGAKGALCLVVPSIKEVKFIDCCNEPSIILKWINSIKNKYNLICITIEDVHSIFGASAKSNFNFGYNLGYVSAIALIPLSSIIRVTPKKWQKHIGVKVKGKFIKKEVARICNKIYPEVEIYGPRGGLKDGYSDSLMIAHYSYQTFKL